LAALFPYAENDYTAYMRLLAATIALCSVVLPTPASGAESSPRQWYESLNALRVDPAAVYTIESANRIELRRGDAKLSFDDGVIAFFAPLEGRVSGAVFAGRGHALALPRPTVEKQQMAAFLGAPVLDQDFITAYLRFTDDSADELLRQLRNANVTPHVDQRFASGWEPRVAQLNPRFSLRILFETLSGHPQHFFYAGLEGVTTGSFDVALDFMRAEQMLFGQLRASENSSFYDIWASYSLPGTSAPHATFHASQYVIEASILNNDSLDATAAVRLRAESAGERLLIFQLSRVLDLVSVTDEHGVSLVFFQNEGMSLPERSVRGSDFLQVILPEAPPPGRDFTLRFHYRGNVIKDAGNGVLFVGARESWYPRLGDAADFAEYDLKMRWPRHLRLAATGVKIEEHEEGEFRSGRWRTERPASVGGFNLGEYASTSLVSGKRTVELYANRQLEDALRKQIAQTPVEILPSLPPSVAMQLPGGPVGMALPPPSPADALKQLGREIDSSIRFYETFCGPFPFSILSVSQIPGTFGQGWPGLLYLSTFSFLPAEAQHRAGLSTSGQEHFTELVPFHEVAHQWWGNIVGWSSYRDQWIDEAIANYLALLFADSQKNPNHKLRVWLERYRKQLAEKSPRTDQPVADLGALTLGGRLNSSRSPEGFDDLVYSKGAWVIHMLRELLRQPGSKNPDARFVALLQTLSQKYANRALSTDDLQHEVENVMTPSMDLEGGHSMEWFFEQWVRGTGIPHYRVEFSAHRGEKGYLVRGKLFQTGVPRSFLAHVPLYAGGGAGAKTFLGTVIATGPETSFSFLAPDAPRRILIDPQVTLLCTSE
jgi:peptidase M1-like protein